MKGVSAINKPNSNTVHFTSIYAETEQENNFIKQRMIKGRTRFVWTSGRKCNFNGCNGRSDLQPAIVKGWFWSGSGVRLGHSTSKDGQERVEGDWSLTGGADEPQPDNRQVSLNT